jgi:UDP-glucose 4-epimerase
MILVVGGAGYIGSHFTYRLRELGRAHIVFDNFEKGHRAAVPGSTVFEGDLRILESLRKVFREHKIEQVVHTAAYISVGESAREPDKYFLNNLVGVQNLLQAMREASVDQLVFSSTAAVYGEPEQVPIPEEHPKRPTSPYGSSKRGAELLMEAAGTDWGLRTTVLRYFNAAGAHPEGLLGEDHTPEEHLIPLALFTADGRRPALKLFGTDYPTEDGTCVRDYVHILDLAQAHLLALDRMAKGSGSSQFNLGNGKGFSVRQVISAVQEVTGKPVPYDEVERRPGDPARLVASSEKAKSELGWQPDYPDLITMVQHAWKWHESHPQGYATT